MTKLEELKIACKATLTDYEAAHVAAEAEYDSCGSSWALQLANDAEAVAAYAFACAARELLTELN
jgi:type IV pilus biogenesis protein CpaD/CtpE